MGYRGLLLTNGFYQSQSFDGVRQMLKEAAAGLNCELKELANDAYLPVLGGQGPDLPQADFALMWNKDVSWAMALETRGVRVFNGSQGVQLCDDKGLTHLMLERAGLPQPATILAPHTYENIGYPNRDYLKQVAAQLGFPMVVKERLGSFGQQVYLVHNMHQLEALTQKLGVIRHLYQAFVPTGAVAYDYRVPVVGGRALCAMRRENQTGDFRANIELGGKGTAVPLTPQMADLATRAVAALGLDFGGVDLLETADGQLLICEVNSNLFFAGLYEATGISAADEILTHVCHTLKKEAGASSCFNR